MGGTNRGRNTISDALMKENDAVPIKLQNVSIAYKVDKINVIVSQYCTVMYCVFPHMLITPWPINIYNEMVNDSQHHELVMGTFATLFIVLHCIS